jgi:hypothetical protein
MLAVFLMLKVALRRLALSAWQDGELSCAAGSSREQPRRYLARSWPSPKSSPSALTAPGRTPVSCQKMDTSVKGSMWCLSAADRIVVAYERAVALLSDGLTVMSAQTMTATERITPDVYPQRALCARSGAT